MEKLNKKMVLFRGAPECGKSTYIKNNGLDPFVLSADEIRLEVSKPQMIDGVYQIPQNNKLVWGLLFKRLEARMQAGELVVIDATNSRTREMLQHKGYADRHGYSVYLVDMTDLPIEICKSRNGARLPEYKRVPDWVIDGMYERFESEMIPDGITVIKPDELASVINN